jgi:hypothetical protein
VYKKLPNLAPDDSSHDSPPLKSSFDNSLLHSPLHSSVSPCPPSSLSQSLPPLDGAGFSHFLCLERLPAPPLEPQVTEQSLQPLQFVYLPSTATEHDKLQSSDSVHVPNLEQSFPPALGRGFSQRLTLVRLPAWDAILMIFKLQFERKFKLYFIRVSERKT